MSTPHPTPGDTPIQSALKIDGFLLEVDYTSLGDSTSIRLAVRSADKVYEIFDPSFRPYFYFVTDKILKKEMMALHVVDAERSISPTRIDEESKMLFGRNVTAFKVFVQNPMDVPKLSSAFSKYGDCYEYDIPFAKRYLVDMHLQPLINATFSVKDDAGRLILESFTQDVNDMVSASKGTDFNVMCFDIETYNPLGVPRPEKDPVIMLSYTYISNGKKGNGVITFKNINLDFIKTVKDEKALFTEFTRIVNDLDIDIITGYNSANFDIKYMLERARALRIKFDLSRFSGDTRIERHGLVDKVKMAGRVHIDMYTVVKFIATVGAAEYILKLNSYTLKNVYEAITKSGKTNVEKKDIYKLWDGSKEDLETLAVYNLSDSKALNVVFDTLAPITIELSKTSWNTLSDVAVSTTGQIVEFLLMRYAHEFGELIPNKPDEYEIKSRLMNPIEGAFVKTPDPGLYENLAIFDFRGLYPSIIISHNIDPSSICGDCTEYYEAPTKVRFSKTRRSITPVILKLLIDQRAEVKKLYKKDKDNIYLGSRSQALKITSNSFYGYLGYARSRWYSRDCAASVTAYGRQYIHDAIEASDAMGFKVIYGDTDSIVMLLGDKTKDEALAFLKGFNAKLPGSMELELEDFYVRGIFVGKKTEKSPSGAKKKYALINEKGYIKIRGFELVRRDWSRVARDTQRRVLETILKEGNPEKAVQIVKDMVKDLKDGKVPMKELAISTQLRKSIDNYDSKSPELGAAKKAVEAGLKTKYEMEHAVISYVITKHGNSISDKAELEEYAKDYDADYYINHQVLPATMRILKELNFKEDELKNDGSQKKL
ncbi:DNA-directed DNA polymerase [Candidatus Marsarchaeota archaeon]|jgi:DNA polymerase I|nr:DNA-directed DNA polymerase [Candidatus Marsarchaeota archaeon]MCL5092252.1 DNA-directed DNA polymerase [Candidatus Marsarchaeota archaeon]